MNDYGSPSPNDIGGRGGWFDSARQRVRAPGLMLQVFGAIMVAVGTMLAVATVVNSEGLMNAYYKWVEDMQKNQPPQERQKLPPKDEAVQSLKIEGPVLGIILLVSGIVMFIGGSKMKDLRGYGWGIAGSILGIFPGLCCCCLPMPFGIWALVVLLNSDVKLAFTRAGDVRVDRDVPPEDRPMDEDWERRRGEDDRR